MRWKRLVTIDVYQPKVWNFTYNLPLPTSVKEISIQYILYYTNLSARRRQRVGMARKLFSFITILLARYNPYYKYLYIHIKYVHEYLNGPIYLCIRFGKEKERVKICLGKKKKVQGKRWCPHFVFLLRKNLLLRTKGELFFKWNWRVEAKKWYEQNESPKVWKTIIQQHHIMRFAMMFAWNSQQNFKISED